MRPTHEATTPAPGAAPAAVPDLDAVTDALYRAALCLTGREDAASRMVEAVADRCIRAGALSPASIAALPCLPFLIREVLEAGLPEADPGPPAGDGRDAELGRALAGFLSLPPEVRLVAALYFTQSVTSRQVAVLVRQPLESVRARLSLARRVLAGAAGPA